MSQAPWPVKLRAAIEVLERTGYASDTWDEPIPDHRLQREIERIEAGLSEDELDRHRRRGELSRRITDEDVTRILAELDERDAAATKASRTDPGR